MKKLVLFVAGLAFVLAAMPTRAKATEVTMTFEGLQNLEPIDNYYNGGLGGNGSGPGPNYGVVFSSDSLALIEGAAGGSGNFDNAPSGVTIAFFLTGAGDTMDVAGGFDTGFSFWYTSAGAAGDVTVWSGLDGTGTELADVSLAALPACGGPTIAIGSAGVAFGGTAQSAIFSGVANEIGFDNITLGAATPGLPEPTTLSMLGLGLAGLLGLGRKRLSAR